MSKMIADRRGGRDHVRIPDNVSRTIRSDQGGGRFGPRLPTGRCPKHDENGSDSPRGCASVSCVPSRTERMIRATAREQMDGAVGPYAP